MPNKKPTSNSDDALKAAEERIRIAMEETKFIENAYEKFYGKNSTPSQSKSGNTRCQNP